MKITTFTVSLTGGTPVTKTEQNITKYKPPQEKKTVKRKYVPKDRMTYGPYLEKMFYDNEIAAYSKKAETYQELKFRFLQDHKSNYIIRKRFNQFKESMGNLQTKYNRRKLHYAQAPVYLLSFMYDKFGYILVNGIHYYTYLTFQEAYRRCLDFKVADPRFVPPELIERLRERQNSEDPQWVDWTVPPISWIESFEKKIGMSAYDSVQFRIGYTRLETPLDCDL